MLNKSFYLCMMLTLCSTSKPADMRDVPCDVESSLFDFNDIFEIEDDEQVKVHEHDSEEVEIEALEEFAVKPQPPSRATVLLRQVGIKMLIGYIAMRTYFEKIWFTMKKSAVQLRSWVLHEQID